MLLDLKAMTPDLHRRLTGMDNQPVHEFARRLAAARKPDLGSLRARARLDG